LAFNLCLAVSKPPLWHNLQLVEGGHYMVENRRIVYKGVQTYFCKNQVPEVNDEEVTYDR
jgi:hypothetical protein